MEPRRAEKFEVLESCFEIKRGKHRERPVELICPTAIFEEH